MQQLATTIGTVIASKLAGKVMNSIFTGKANKAVTNSRPNNRKRAGNRPKRTDLIRTQYLQVATSAPSGGQNITLNGNSTFIYTLHDTTVYAGFRNHQQQVGVLSSQTLLTLIGTTPVNRMYEELRPYYSHYQSWYPKELRLVFRPVPGSEQLIRIREPLYVKVQADYMDNLNIGELIAVKPMAITNRQKHTIRVTFPEPKAIVNKENAHNELRQFNQQNFILWLNACDIKYVAPPIGYSSSLVECATWTVEIQLLIGLRGSLKPSESNTIPAETQLDSLGTAPEERNENHISPICALESIEHTINNRHRRELNKLNREWGAIFTEENAFQSDVE